MLLCKNKIQKRERKKTNSLLDGSQRSQDEPEEDEMVEETVHRWLVPRSLAGLHPEFPPALGLFVLPLRAGVWAPNGGRHGAALGVGQGCCLRRTGWSATGHWTPPSLAHGLAAPEEHSAPCGHWYLAGVCGFPFTLLDVHRGFVWGLGLGSLRSLQ